jgi:hypothetical protein
MVKVNFEEDN